MLRRIKEKVLAGERVSKDEALELFEIEDIFFLGDLASHVAEKKNGKNVFFIRNRHINPTNICINRCRFCAFSRSKGEEGAFELTIDEIIKKLQPSRYTSDVSRLTPYREVHIVGGLHPDWPFEYYLNMLSMIKKNFPELHIKAFTAVEIDYMSRISCLSLGETLLALKRHGLELIPGGGAEIFDDKIRSRLCPEKISGERWLEVMETAHRLGIKTNATMLYGHIENYKHRVDHLLKLRDLQDRTGGFQAFIPLSYHPKGNEIGGSYSSGIDDLKTISVSRVVLDNFDHITAYWIMLGEKISQLSLIFGADDLSGTVIEERITHSAGALSAESMTPEQFIYLIRMAGKVPTERDSFYRQVKSEKL
ncbi:MAG: aminofutalosine synthase MqnE [Thermodesulfovibrionales bacterium]|nr:aminofutalosine synthase MqnE [Thermodesulfovibrionales bacterium]